MPRLPNGACSETVSGKARCRNCPNRLVEPTVSAACWLSSAATVLRSAGEATSALVDHGTTIGWRACRLARSPSTSTASIGPATVEARRRVPAIPCEPVVEASTTVRCNVSPARSRASSISVAVPDRLAWAGEDRASREATMTMLPVPIPGRTPTTFSSVRVPSAVAPEKMSLVTPKPLLLKLSATESANDLSPSDPGRRSWTPLGPAIESHAVKDVLPVESVRRQRRRHGALLILQREGEDEDGHRHQHQAGPVDARIEHPSTL